MALALESWPRGLIDEKPEGRKSCDSVPLKKIILLISPRLGVCLTKNIGTGTFIMIVLAIGGFFVVSCITFNMYIIREY
jgi:uncharacterized membrane protein YqaE (UPF0057 family)